MKVVRLETKKELEIYMNPTRQELLRLLALNPDGMTPKMLSDRLSISASGVQYHINKLESLGLVALGRTQMINGITAKYYKAQNVTVSIGLAADDGTEPNRRAILQNAISRVHEGFYAQIDQMKAEDTELSELGDCMSGILHLSRQEAKELLCLIRGYVEAHSAAEEKTSPWEYALILYNAEEKFTHE